MNCVVEDISITKKRLTFEVKADIVEGEIKKALNELRGRTKLPGFRPGKVPVSLLDKKYGKDVEKDVLDRIVAESFSGALQESKLTPITTPVFETDFRSEFKRNIDLKIVCLMEVRPEIENLVYEGLPTKEIDVKIEDDEINARLQGLQKSKGAYEPADREIREDDLVVLDFEDVDNNNTYADQYVRFELSSIPENTFNALLGKNIGDSVEITDSFPDTFPVEDFHGKRVNLKITVKDNKEFVIPELDDELAKDIGFDGIADLKKNVGEELEKMKKEYLIKEQKAKLIKSLSDKHDFEVPQSILDSELAKIVAEARQTDKHKDKTEEALKEEFKDEVKQSVKAMIILSTIGDRENVSVADNEIQEKIYMLSQMMSMSPEALIQFYKNQGDGSLDGIRDMIYREKVMDLIYSKAKIEKGE